jgi:hypothetical protein
MSSKKNRLLLGVSVIAAAVVISGNLTVDTSGHTIFRGPMSIKDIIRTIEAKTGMTEGDNGQFRIMVDTNGIVIQANDRESFDKLAGFVSETTKMKFDTSRSIFEFKGVRQAHVGKADFDDMLVTVAKELKLAPAGTDLKSGFDHARWNTFLASIVDKGTVGQTFAKAA